ncbi:MAG: UDP-N-acetylmuramate--L-alanine ligase [Bacillota bacterium]
MQNIDLTHISKIHFIGIGGSSMCGLASFMLHAGKQVSGSDMTLNEATDELALAGANIRSPHDASNISTFSPDLVVYTVAVRGDNPELVQAAERGIPIIERAVFLGLIMKDFSKSIAVAGTHGKTTTTSMISSILIENNLDPSVHIGGKLPLINSNTLIGSSDYFVTEACEYNDSFLNFNPYIAVILNVEHDHVDYFKTFEQFKASFKNFLALVPAHGHIVVCGDDPNALEVASGAKCKVTTYGISSPDFDWSARDIDFDENGCGNYTLLHCGTECGRISLGTVGIHNVRNSLASIATAVLCDLTPAACILPLKNFTGANRRFEFKGYFNEVKVIDDYAHHPTEILTTLAAARAATQAPAKIIITFQPHTYTRTRELFNEFAHAFGDADEVIMADIYAAREADPGNVSIHSLVDEINKVSANCVYKRDFEAIAAYVREIANPHDLVITMGAGDICKVADLLLKQ